MPILLMLPGGRLPDGHLTLIGRKPTALTFKAVGFSSVLAVQLSERLVVCLSYSEISCFRGHNRGLSDSKQI
jgi:hypothetical protein